MSSFSKDISKPIVLKDSTGVTLIAFTEEHVNIIIKGLKEGGLNKKLVSELENKVSLLKYNNNLLLEKSDSLKKQIDTYIEIKINLKSQISVQEKSIEIYKANIEDYKKIESNLTTVVDNLNHKVVRKNKWIVRLALTNTLTVVLLIIAIF